MESLRDRAILSTIEALTQMFEHGGAEPAAMFSMAAKVVDTLLTDGLIDDEQDDPAVSAVVERLDQGWVLHRVGSNGSWWWGKPRDANLWQACKAAGAVPCMAEVTQANAEQVAAYQRIVG